jgi:hypothetical protein
VGDDLLLDQVLAQLGQRPLGHANERDRRRQGDFHDVFANVPGEHTRRPHLKPGIPGDPADPVVVEPMQDLPDPLGGAPDHLGNAAMALLADSEHHNAGIATVHGIAPLPLQAT